MEAVRFRMFPLVNPADASIRRTMPFGCSASGDLARMGHTGKLPAPSGNAPASAAPNRDAPPPPPVGACRGERHNVDSIVMERAVGVLPVTMIIPLGGNRLLSARLGLLLAAAGSMIYRRTKPLPRLDTTPPD